MKTKLIKIIILSLIVIGIAFGCYCGVKAYLEKKNVLPTNQYIITTVKKMRLQETVQGTGVANSASDKSVLSNNNSILQDIIIKARISVDESDISKIKVGQKAEVNFNAISGKTFEGTMESIAEIETISKSVTTYDAVIRVKNPVGIKAGMNANVIVDTEIKDNALVIPVRALVKQNGKEFVRVESISSSNTRTLNIGSLKAIKIGMETQDYIEVTEGITEGEMVVVKLPSASSTTNKNTFSSHILSIITRKLDATINLEYIASK